jgi:N-methylhydantoinase A
MWSVGADIGGTFTDVVALSDLGQLKRVKVLTTYDAFTVGVARGLAQCLDAGELEDVGRLVHGTTVATNAILQGQRAPVALITTQGFRDVLELRPPAHAV